ncbi:uncharacterized protein LOC143964191 [Lithobates pipiens]
MRQPRHQSKQTKPRGSMADIADASPKKPRKKAAKRHDRTSMQDREEQSPAVKGKASAMSRAEMVDMVFILEKHDYDGKMKRYERPNTRKDLILEKVVELLQRKHGVNRSKDQLRKRWSDLKLREHEQFNQIQATIQKRKKLKLAKKRKRRRVHTEGPEEHDQETSPPDPTKKKRLDEDVVVCQSSQGPSIYAATQLIEEEDSGHVTFDESSNLGIPQKDDIIIIENEQEIKDVPSNGEDTLSTNNQEDFLERSSPSRPVFNTFTVGQMSSALLQCSAELQTIKDCTSSIITRLKYLIDLLAKIGQELY